MTASDRRAAIEGARLSPATSRSTAIEAAAPESSSEFLQRWTETQGMCAADQDAYLDEHEGDHAIRHRLFRMAMDQHGNDAVLATATYGRFERMACDEIHRLPPRDQWDAMSRTEQEEWRTKHEIVFDLARSMSDWPEDEWIRRHPFKEDEQPLPELPPARRRKPAATGQVVRGKRYRGAKRDYSGEPYFYKAPENIETAIRERRLREQDNGFAGALSAHIERTKRYVKDKSKRTTCAELGTMRNRSADSAQRSVSRMLAAKELFVVKPGKGRIGAIYAFPPRKSKEQAK